MPFEELEAAKASREVESADWLARAAKIQAGAAFGLGP